MADYKTITVRTQFEALHCYPDAPDCVGFLRVPHRHVFHVKATIEVFHEDRELEFFIVKDVIDTFLATMKKKMKMETSCENMATALINELQLLFGKHRIYEVEVQEDNENSATVRRLSECTL